MDPDPYSEYGSRKLLDTDPIRIRIHNPEFATYLYTRYRYLFEIKCHRLLAQLTRLLFECFLICFKLTSQVVSGVRRQFPGGEKLTQVDPRHPLRTPLQVWSISAPDKSYFMYRIWPHLAGRLNSNQLGMLLFVTPSVVNPDPVGLVIFSWIRNYLFRIRMTESKQKNLDKLIKGIFLQFSGMFKIIGVRSWTPKKSLLDPDSK